MRSKDLAFVASRKRDQALRVLSTIATIGLIWAVLGVGLGNAEPADGQAVQVDGKRVAYRVFGHERPVLVMICGLGEGMASFNGVASDLAENATVIVYDHAGRRASDEATTRSVGACSCLNAAFAHPVRRLPLARALRWL